VKAVCGIDGFLGMTVVCFLSVNEASFFAAGRESLGDGFSLEDMVMISWILACYLKA
jgi:hypothetical protein